MVISSRDIALMCPGQASQKVGMCEDIYINSEFGKEHIDLANSILGYDIKKIMFSGPIEILTKTIYTQPAIFIASYIVGSILINNGLRPKFIAGHSVGEITAYALARSLSFEDGLKLVQFRATAMHEAGSIKSGSMAAVIGLNEESLQGHCANYTNGIVCVANYNSPNQAVISGDSTAIENISSELLKAGAIKVIKLNVSGAFHSPLMGPAKDKLDKYIQDVDINDAIFPVYSNVSATPVTEKNKISNSLVEQLVSPVLWYKSVENMILGGIKTGIEIGSGKVLQGLAKRINSSLNMYGAETHQDILNLGHV